jgi:hypothetical protein
MPVSNLVELYTVWTPVIFSIFTWWHRTIKELEHQQQIREYKKQQKEQFEAFVTESKEREDKLLHEIVLRNMELKTN